jgi:hypothetical protein
MKAYDIKIECEEDGFHIIIDGDSIDPEYQAGQYGWKIEDPEALYDAVKGAIGPWLRERDEARRTLPVAFVCDPDESGGYDLSDPKHAAFHSTHVALWDERDGK